MCRAGRCRHKANIHTGTVTSCHKTTNTLTSPRISEDKLRVLQGFILIHKLDVFVMIYKACEEYQRVKVQVHKKPPIKALSTPLFPLH